MRNANNFAASLLIWHCSLLPLILSSTVMVSIYILSTRFFLKREQLSYARVAPVTKKEYGIAVHFL